jgi:DNA invertase Pin-like site-specific DNA recombinase
MISDRTKAALAAAKARGIRLGNPNGAAHLRGLGNAPAVAALRAGAQNRADDLRPAIDDLRAAGVTSARELARGLNERGILTPRGGAWHAASVQRVLRRLDP